MPVGNFPPQPIFPVAMPQMQKKVPDFRSTAVVNYSFREMTLKDFAGKYLVLVFYPMDFTANGAMEIMAFSERAAEFRQNNSEVVICTTNSHLVNFAWVNKQRKKGGLGEVDLAILSDKSMQIARDYGVLNEGYGLTYRATFIANRTHMLRHMSVNDMPVGRNVDETLRLVQAFNFADEYGELCPINWRPGQKALPPDTEKARPIESDSEPEAEDEPEPDD